MAFKMKSPFNLSWSQNIAKRIAERMSDKLVDMPPSDALGPQNPLDEVAERAAFAKKRKNR